jgi:hypothetical protein
LTNALGLNPCEAKAASAKETAPKNMITLLV